ncbi:hypothetical protein [Paenibacillus sp. MMO-177]|uniref:hypothetical protein n=1 Tax=Paenibacillus sp. MMO-177 TaxID=3081289 RepID=UPI00301AB7AA
MIIGLDMIGAQGFKSLVPPVTNATYLEVENCVADVLQLQTNIDNDDTKDKWGYGTVLLATFNGDLEAGNIQMRENPISELRVKRRNLKDQNFIVVKELPFNPEPTQIVYDDYTVSSGEEYEYVIAPVDASGIEGFMTATYINPKFDGWWIVDPDQPELYNFQFLYNLDDVNITVDEDRTEINTFSKFPKVYYGQKYARRGSLSSLFIPEGYNAKEQYERLIAMINAKKPYILKDGYGRNFRVDISAPQETVQARMAGVTKVAVNWVEVGEVND